MPAFQVGTRVEATTNTVDVTADPTGWPVRPGVPHFHPIVVDHAGNQSAPTTARVVVRDVVNPTRVLSIEPSQVQPGQAFRLNGSGASDAAAWPVAIGVSGVASDPMRAAGTAARMPQGGKR